MYVYDYMFQAQNLGQGFAASTMMLLSVLIGPTGAVEKVKVLESQPSGVFDDVAIAGVQGWKFEPAQYKGENVRVWATQKVSFTLG